MSKDFTILVSSCDKYEDLWIPFFSILKESWKEIGEYSIVLNTESKYFSMEGLNIKCFQLYGSNQKVKWGKRLIETLNKIDTDYVVFLLDDFFLTQNVDDYEIKKCIELMENDSDIAVFYFLGGEEENEEKSNIPGYNLKKQNAPWKLNTQAAVWRRDLLCKYVRPHESAWDWEIYGSERSRRYTEKFYIRRNDTTKVFDYDAAWGGAIHRGKWTPYAIELCNSKGFSIDYCKRGIETIAPPYDKRPEIEGLNIFQRVFRRPFWKRMIIIAKKMIVDKNIQRIIRYKSLK